MSIFDRIKRLARAEISEMKRVLSDRDAPRTARPTTSPYEGRTHAFPREIRDAYAALELPLGSPREAVEQAFRDMLHRYHPDKHAGDQRRQAMAHELTIRIREARQLLTSWLAGA